jgi:hypothetical protein
MNKIEIFTFAFAVAIVATIGLLSIDLGLFVLSTRSLHTPFYIIGVKLAVKGLHDIKQAFVACTGKGACISIDDQ